MKLSAIGLVIFIHDHVQNTGTCGECGMPYYVIPHQHVTRPESASAPLIIAADFGLDLFIKPNDVMAAPLGL